MTVLIPLVKGGKRPIPRAWSKPDANWSEWWTPELQVPDTANIGRRCDGLIVVDCDSAAAAEHWETFGFPTAHIVETPRGRHYYYGLPEGAQVRTGPWRGHPGIDIKSGSGHFVVCPPSVSASGKAYRWLGSNLPPMPDEAPRAMLDLLAGPSEPKAEAGGVRLIPEGSRNNELTAWAGFMRRRGYDDAAVSQVLHGLNRSLTETPLPPEEVQAIVQSSARWDPEEMEIVLVREDTPLLVSLSEMTLPPPPTWHWRPYLPEGRLVMLDGSEGIGKSLFCAQLATSMASGRWPDGGTERGAVLWLTAEDDPEDDVQRRMLAAGYRGGEHEEVWFLTVDPVFPKHIEHLEKIVLDKGVRLIIMDPGRSYLAAPKGVEMSFNNEAALRPALQALNRLTRQVGVTAVFVHHWNKSADRKVQYRQGGSAAFAQVVRHRISMVWAGTTESGQGAFEVTKSNIGPRGGLRAYSVVPHPQYDTAVLVIGDLLPDADLDAWLRAREQTVIEIDKADALSTWAERHLAPGDRLPSKAALAARAGLSESGVRQALAALEDEGRVVKHGNGYEWRG